MDCKTARLLLVFARPAASELDEPELDALHAHLADCPECGPAAQAERRADDRMGRAVRAVPLPDGLRQRLHTRLAQERRTGRRRRLAWQAAAGAVAAALLLAAWLGRGVVQPRRLNPEQAAADLVARSLNPTPETVEHWFRGQGVEITVPADFDYAALRYYDLADLQGRQVPLLLFLHEDKRAAVYILSDRQFDLTALDRSLPLAGSGYNVELRPVADPRLRYLVVYTGGSLVPFLERRQAAGRT